MPPESRNPKAGRVQTLREARRAYRRAGGVPVLSAAQIRAAARAAEGEKRAAEIKAREKRDSENKRKKGEQELKHRQEQKRLVQLGKLPEESLWGKVRSSQPRLHTFLNPTRNRQARHADNATGSQSKASGSLQRSASFNGEHFDSQTPFPATQLLAMFLDDRALEAELNPQSMASRQRSDTTAAPVVKCKQLTAASSSKKRKAEGQPCLPAPIRKVARSDLTTSRPFESDDSEQKEANSFSEKWQRERSHCPPGNTDLIDMPTNSQLEALISADGYEDDGREQNADTTGQSAYSQRDAVPASRQIPDSPAGRDHVPGRPCSKKPGTSMKSAESCLFDCEADKIMSNQNGLEKSSDEEFGADADENVLAMSSRMLDATKPSSKGAERSKDCEDQHLSERLLAKCTVHPLSIMLTDRNFHSSTPEQQYSFESVGDEDLAGLAGLFDCNPRAVNAVE